jgi:hypothetical protein
VELIYDMSLEQFLVRPNAANSRLGGCELALCRGSRGVGFFSTLIGMLLSFKRVFRSAWLSALLFAAAFVYWKLLSARLAAADNDHHPECVGPGRNR